MLNLDFGLPCRTSPRRCSEGSPGGWNWISFLQNEDSLKNYDDWLKTGGDI